jgi:hypothetical protein
MLTKKKVVKYNAFLILNYFDMGLWVLKLFGSFFSM